MPKVLFVLGSYRSGTTLVARLLNACKGVFIAKETSFLRDIDPNTLNEVVSGSAAPAASDRTWREINMHLAGEQWSALPSREGFTAFLGTLEPGTGTDIGAFMRYIWQLESPEPYDRLQVIGDNTPRYVAEPALLAEHFPEARFLHIVRDPRDVIASVIPLHFGANNAYSAAREWAARINDWKQLTQLVGDGQCKEIRYEDLVADADETVRNIFEFLGVSREARDMTPGDRIPASAKEVSALAHHANLSKPVSREFIGSYKSRLSRRQIQLIEYICAPMMREYGYQPENQTPRLPFPYCEAPMRLSYSFLDRCHMIQRRLKKKRQCR